ncbi:Fic family protein [Subtercola endophyticus]|uniref:Fic family protein n=1 Tax=Subtercola endophyticus TaxID=2895559 RepID=UPI001E503213|nr:Fic family protein [Subtercola endophyticus]UFS57987.1 Fic family protein [Subtercola endophyticus]
MKTIHRRLFRDIYDWAGHERVGPTTPVVRFAPDAVNYEAGDPAAPFVKYAYFSGPEIAEAASVQYALLASLPLRTDLTRTEVIDLFAEYGGELQTIHAFRDGNVRASCVYGIFFAEAIGYPVDPAVFLMGRELRDRLMHARFHNQATGTHGAYFDTLNLAMAPERNIDRNADRFVRP